MSEVIEWAWFLGAVVFGSYFLTEALRYVCPDITARHRWAAVFWLFAAVGSFRIAWEVS